MDGLVVSVPASIDIARPGFGPGAGGLPTVQYEGRQITLYNTGLYCSLLMSRLSPSHAAAWRCCCCWPPRPRRTGCWRTGGGRDSSCSASPPGPPHPSPSRWRRSPAAPRPVVQVSIIAQDGKVLQKFINSLKKKKSFLSSPSLLLRYTSSAFLLRKPEIFRKYFTNTMSEEDLMNFTTVSYFDFTCLLYTIHYTVLYSVHKVQYTTVYCTFVQYIPH